jgi:hypothetical protein
MCHQLSTLPSLLTYCLLFTIKKHFFIFCNITEFQAIFNENISNFKECVIVYIAGYVVKMVQKKISCSVCVSALVCSRLEAEEKPSFALLNRKRWGNLTDASSDLILVCIETERIFISLEKQCKIESLSSITTKIASSILKHFFQRSD